MIFVPVYPIIFGFVYPIYFLLTAQQSLLVHNPAATTAPLQRVQNAAAGLVFELGPKEHVTPSLLQLHWLWVRWWVQFKICCLMHSIYRGNSPEYLKNIVRSVAASRSRPALRSVADPEGGCGMHPHRRGILATLRLLIYLFMDFSRTVNLLCQCQCQS